MTGRQTCERPVTWNVSLAVKGSKTCLLHKAHLPGLLNLHSLTKAARTVNSFCTATCMIEWPSSRGSSI